jgi:hypothetical protein
MATLEAELLFKLQITFGEPALVGNIGKGTRSIGGGPGRVEGPQIKGAIELTDWVLMRPDGAGEVDVRGTIRTDDGAVIYMYYTGILDLSKAPPSGSPGRFRFAPACASKPARNASPFSTALRAWGSGSRISTRIRLATTSMH